MGAGRDREEFWGELYGRLMANCGYTPGEIDAMTMRDINRLYNYWSKHPPAADILAAVHGVKTSAANSHGKRDYNPALQSSPACQAMIADNLAFMKEHGIRLHQ